MSMLPLPRLRRRLGLLFLLLPLLAQAGQAPVQPAVAKLPALSAPSYILLDGASSEVLAQKDPDLRRDPASLTKMMTAYIVFNEIRAGRVKLTDQVTISRKAWRTGGTRTFLEVDSQVSVDVLLKGLTIQSGNDAAVALAEHVAGSEAAFVQLMNAYASRLGMRHTRFMNPHGLPHRQHYSTARDLARLAQAQVRDFPEHQALFTAREYTWNNIRQFNRNKLLWRDPSVDGMKTGYTVRARYCQVATARRQGRRVVAVLLGARTPGLRIRETQALIDHGFRLLAPASAVVQEGGD